MGPIQPPIQWIILAIFLGVERPGREAHYSSTSSAKVKNCGIIPSLPYTPS
jgi:hypothetical protein